MDNKDTINKEAGEIAKLLMEKFSDNWTLLLALGQMLVQKSEKEIRYSQRKIFN